MITSTAKITPAIGALKVAAIPAAAPQPNKTIRRFPSKPNACPIPEVYLYQGFL